MAGTSGAIRAGRAYVEAFLDRSKFDQQIRGWKDKLNSFATGLRVIADSFAIGRQILAPIQRLVTDFMEAGDRLHELSSATGISVESLSLLGAVAARSGGDIEQIAKGLGFMNRELFKIGGPSDKFVESLNAVGLSVEQLKGMSPEERITAIAQALSGVSDEGQQAALAAALLGRGGAELLPFINSAANLGEELERVKALGIGIEAEDAAIVDEFGDNWADVKDQLRAFGAQIASAVLPVLTSMLKILQPILLGVINWAKENHGLIRVIAGVVLGAVAFSVALGGIATVITTLLMIGPGLLLALKLLFLAFGAIVGVLIGPAGIIGAILYFSGALDGVIATIKNVIGGIWDAIMAGNWALAGQQAALALQIGWQMGVNMLRQIWDDFATWVVGRLDFAATAVGATWQAMVAELLGAASQIPGMEELGVMAEALRQQVGGAASGFDSRERERAAASEERTAEAEAKLAEMHAALAAMQAKSKEEREALAEKLKVDATQAQGDFAVQPTATAGSGYGALEGNVAAMLASEFTAAAAVVLPEHDAAMDTAAHTKTLADNSEFFKQKFQSGELGSFGIVLN